MTEDENISPRFSSEQPLIVLTRPAGAGEDWQELDRGPGYFYVPDGHEIRVRIKSISDAELYDVVQELREVEDLRFLDLSENRNVTNEGMKYLRSLPQLTALNLGSCSITNAGLEHLRALPRLESLYLSYCNKLTDAALKTLEAMKRLTYVDLQGCLSITKAGLARVRRRDLTIYR